MKQGYLLLLLIALIIAGVFVYQDNTDHKKNVIVFQIVDHEALNETRRGVEDYLRSCCSDLHILNENAQGNISLASQIAKKIINEEPLAVVAIGTVAAQSFLRNKETPVIFSSVTDPIKSGLVKSIERPGSNFTGVSNMIDVETQLKLITDILPEAHYIGIIYNPSESNSVEILNQIKRSASKMQLNIIEAPINSSNDVFIATQSLIDQKIDAIFISNDNTALSSIKGIVKIATSAKMPVFCSDIDTVNSGVLAAVGPNQYKIGLQTGAIVEKIAINSSEPQNIPVEFPKEIELKINLATAKKLGITIQEDLVRTASEVVE
jgi:putative tryptophan/tyrosine transport system substrate-binding protein